MRESATKNRVAFSPKKRESLLVERVESNLVDRVGKWIALLITFAIPIEHKYDKFLRFFSIKIIPSTLFLPPGYDPKIYIYASDILSLILFGLLLYTFKSSLRRILFENGSLFLWTLFFSALCSLIFSPFSTYLTAYTRLLQLFTPIAIYCFISSRLMDVRPFFYALLIAGCVQSCIAIAQYFAQDSLGLRLLSESRDPPSAFIMENAKLTLFGPSMATDIIRRASGTLPHSNILGGFLVVSIMSTFSLIAKEKQKFFFSTLLFLQCFALNTSYSRAAIFGLILASTLWFAWSFFQKQSFRFLAFAGIISGLLCSFIFFEQNLARGGLMNYNQTAKNADKERIEAQLNAINMIQKHPTVGVGYGQFTRESSKAGSVVPTHNIYLFVLSEMGLFGFFSLFGFSLFILLQVYKAPFNPELASLAGAFFAFLFIGVCDFYPITSQQGKLLFFIIGAFTVAKAKEAHGKLANI